MDAERQEEERKWKGLYICSECGYIARFKEEIHCWKGTPYGYCRGLMLPYERRNISEIALKKAREEAEADKARLIEALKDCITRMNRARKILVNDQLDAAEWMMLDTKQIVNTLTEIKRKEKMT